MAGQELRVLFEDPALIIVDKPAGIHTAPLRPGETGTLINLVTRSYPDVAAVPGIKPMEPGLVHRLDRDTSGLVVIARTVEAFDALRRSFAAGGARKDYLAACACAGDHTEAVRIESRFAPYGPGRRMVRAVLAGEKSRKLLDRASRETYVTEARVTRRTGADGIAEGTGGSLAGTSGTVAGTSGGRVMIAASILRGFRHQVRAHLAFLGFLILGDPLYGAPVPPGFADRMYLHAARISMNHPSTGLPLVVEAPLPPEFDALFR
jgi:23S rRNA pseudouridine1911/1915/1917 synthase